ncbi:hypothetical protein [Lutibacter sp. TH_r2]|uniref:hypothetical protein n=1 Tax=Lutibacter sp. TH_r2 TaxID=3082083 RepID=UPI0039868D37
MTKGDYLYEFANNAYAKPVAGLWILRNTIMGPELVFEKPGDLVMPIVVEFEFEDETKERKQYPAQIWRLNDNEVTKVYPSSKAIKKITIDPDQETADVDTSNNSWPKNTESEFDKFKKNNVKG